MSGRYAAKLVAYHCSTTSTILILCAPQIVKTGDYNLMLMNHEGEIFDMIA